MTKVKVTPSWLKTGFILEESDKTKSWDILFEEQPLFRYLASYVFNGVSNTPKMRETRKVMRKLITLDDDEINEGSEKDYDVYLDKFFSKLEKAPLSELVEQLALIGYVTSDGKNRAFSSTLLQNMEIRNTKLIDLNNDLKVNQLLGHRYGKGLDETDVDDTIKDKKRAEKRREEKYDKRSSRILGAFDRGEPVLYASTLSKHMTVSGKTISIDTEAYFTELFRIEGYGKIGTDSFQFNASSSTTMATDKEDMQAEADEWAEKKFPNTWSNFSAKERVEGYKGWKKDKKEESQAELSGFYEDSEDDDEGITVDEEKMLTKAQTSNALITLKINKNHTYVLDAFEGKQYFDNEDIIDNRDELWDAIDDIKLLTKKEIMDIVKSQRKSYLKDYILDVLTPNEHKIQIGQVTITLNLKEWGDDDEFFDWLDKGAGRGEDKKDSTTTRKIVERLKKLHGLLELLKKKWGSYVYSEKESPYDKFMQTLLPMSKKELIDFFSLLIVSVKEDKNNLDNPEATESKWVELYNTLDDQLYELFTYGKINPDGSKPERATPRVTSVEGKKKPIGIEETVYDEDGQPSKDEQGNIITEIKNYYPAFGNHDELVSILEAILKNVKSADYRERIKFISFLEHIDNKNKLTEVVNEEVVGSKNWIGDENSPQYRIEDSTVDILTFSVEQVNRQLVDTKIGRRHFKGFKRGRFSEKGAGASKKQKKKRKEVATDEGDAEELTLVYHEYVGLKQLIATEG